MTLTHGLKKVPEDKLTVTKCNSLTLTLRSKDHTYDLAEHFLNLSHESVLSSGAC